MTSFGPSFTMTAGGNPGTATEGHDIIVYAFFTTTAGVAPNTFVAYVAAVHQSFQDNPADVEQSPDNKKIHAHDLELDNITLCVTGLGNSPTVTVISNTVTINGAAGTVANWVMAGYDQTGSAGGLFGGSGLCPTEVYVLN